MKSISIMSCYVSSTEKEKIHQKMIKNYTTKMSLNSPFIPIKRARATIKASVRKE